jgi:protein subunit release factor B
MNRRKPILKLNEAELEESFSRSSGPGGQNVNKVSTRVILRHIPTDITIAVQDSRSQYMNRQLARERMLEALQKRQTEAEARVVFEKEKLRRQKAVRPRGVKERILSDKKRRSRTKSERNFRTD